MIKIGQQFFNRSPILVVQDILGKILIRNFQGNILSGRIIEVEAYLHESDEAAHSYVGRKKRNSILWQEPGYIYMHSMHGWDCIDITCEDKDIPSSILVRGLHPIDGINIMMNNRNTDNQSNLCDGPGKLCKSLAIDKSFYGMPIFENPSLYILDDGFIVNKDRIINTKRIGVTKSQDLNLRFRIEL